MSMKHLQFDFSVIFSFNSAYRIEAPNSTVLEVFILLTKHCAMERGFLIISEENVD